jgi:hypothetical protein
MIGVGFPKSHGVIPDSQDFSQPSDQEQQQQIKGD